MENTNDDLAEYPDLSLEELDSFLSEIEDLKAEPEKLDKMYLSTLFIRKIFPKLINFKKIFRFLKYHIFTLHPRIEERLTSLETQVAELRNTNQSQNEQLSRMLSTQNSMIEQSTQIGNVVADNNNNILSEIAALRSLIEDNNNTLNSAISALTIRINNIQNSN